MAFIGRLPVPTTEAWDWQAQASCRGMASSFFFHPWGERGPSRDQRVVRAKEVCASCPVIDACRQHALEVQEQYGVWGGLSEEERLVLLNRGRRSLRRKVLAKSADLREMMAGEQATGAAEPDIRVGVPSC
ncbi:WhiB family transcriptional regulator [Nakamurella sp.]|uniref:WhiB family transcriptional regulator n=1 Tax=Nakamurella sp. TaxID=1869182 RepID=UPI003784A528